MQQNIGSSLGKAKRERLFVDFLERRAIMVVRHAQGIDRPAESEKYKQPTRSNKLLNGESGNIIQGLPIICFKVCFISSLKAAI